MPNRVQRRPSTDTPEGWLARVASMLRKTLGLLTAAMWLVFGLLAVVTVAAGLAALGPVGLIPAAIPLALLAVPFLVVVVLLRMASGALRGVERRATLSHRAHVGAVHAEAAAIPAAGRVANRLPVAEPGPERNAPVARPGGELRDRLEGLGEAEAAELARRLSRQRARLDAARPRPWWGWLTRQRKRAPGDFVLTPTLWTRLDTLHDAAVHALHEQARLAEAAAAVETPQVRTRLSDRKGDLYSDVVDAAESIGQVLDHAQAAQVEASLSDGRALEAAGHGADLHLDRLTSLAYDIEERIETGAGVGSEAGNRRPRHREGATGGSWPGQAHQA